MGKHSMKLNWNGVPLSDAIKEAAEELGLYFGEDGLPVYAAEGTELRLSRSARGIEFSYGGIPQLCRGLSLLAEERLKTEPIVQKPVFPALGLMLDVSRGAIPRVETMKAVFRKLAVLGYNEVMLYTEDTYPVPGQPWFGYLRGGYDREELWELDQYAKELGMELIPCIQTLAHLERFLHWPAVRGKYWDSEDVLLADSPDTDALLEEMFCALRACYSSHRIHIGMDEAMGLGLGRHLAQHGYELPLQIMLRHLKKVCALCEKYEFAPMMWSDMFFRLLSRHGDYYDVTELPEEIKQALQGKVQPVYWDYYHDDPAFYRERLQIHGQLAPKISFAGGGWNWISPVTDYELCVSRSIPALEACRETGTSEVWLTLWGDDGGEASVWSSMLAATVYAEYCYTGMFKETDVFRRLEACFGIPASALAELSRFNRPGTFSEKIGAVNAAKFLLYQDPLLGILDEDLRGRHAADTYEALAVQYAAFAEQAAAPYDRLFRFYEKLADFLSVRAELGISIQDAYGSNDRAALKRLTTQTLPEAQRRLEALRCAWRTEWMATNRPIGFEVHDLRLGGAAARLDSAQERLMDYLEGRITCIEELEQMRQPYLASRGPGQGCYFWQDAASACRL